MSKINSLSPGLLNMYYRSQSDEVKHNVRKALGLFSLRGKSVNSGKEKETK